MVETLRTELQTNYVEKIPEADFYSTLIAKYPWRVWSFALCLILLVSGLGVGITLGAKDFSLGGATVGFENRGTDLSGEINFEILLPKYECYGTLSLMASQGSKKFTNRAVEQVSEDPMYTDWTECYSGYVTAQQVMENDGNQRRLSIPEHDGLEPQQQVFVGRELKYGLLGYNYDPLLVSEEFRTVMNGEIEGIPFTSSAPDVMTVESLKAVKEFETTVSSLFPSWDSKLCKKDELIWPINSQSEVICRPARSMPNYVAALSNVTISDLTQTHVDNVKTLLKKCRPYYESTQLVGNCWDYQKEVYTSKMSTSSSDPACSLEVSDYDCAQYNAVYDIFNALTPTGYMASFDTLETTQSIMSNYDNYDDKVSAWKSIETIIGQKKGDVTLENVYLPGAKGRLFNSMMTGSLGNFVFLFAGSYLLILYHTGSLWITTCGVFQILMAFGWGFFFYNIVLWRPFFPFLNLIALFLVMGIGADDLFVFVDAWKQSFTLLPAECPLANRLSWVMRRAGSAMFITTLTTTVSFVANTLSPVTSLKGFGLFTASVVFSDFLLMVLFVPPTMCLYYLHFSPEAGIAQLAADKNKCFKEGCYGCKIDEIAYATTKSSDGDIEMVTTKQPHYIDVTDGELPTDEPKMLKSDAWYNNIGLNPIHGRDVLDSHESCGCSNCICCVTTCDLDYCAVPSEIESDGRAKQRWSEDLFEGPISNILFHDYGRWAFSLVLLGISIWLATNAVNLEKPTSDYMQMLSATNHLEIYESSIRNQFDIGDGKSFQFPYRLSYGLKPVDNGDPFNPMDRGTLEFSDHFDASSASSQEFLLNLCQKLADWNLTPQSDLNLAQNPCSMFWFKSWMEHDCSQTGGLSGDYMTSQPSRATCCNKVNADFPYSPSEFNTCVGEFSDYWGSNDVNHGFWWQDGKVKAITMEGATIEKYARSFNEADKFYKNIKEWYSDNVISTPGLPDGLITTEINFYALQKAITDGAWESAALSALFALCILVMMTRRLLSSIISAFQIVCVVASVLGVFVLLGWELNIIEAVIMSVSVGIACDFSVHLAHSFNEGIVPHEADVPKTFPRSIAELKLHYVLATHKATNAIKELGVTLFMGFVSTFFSGLILLTNDLYFFQQFGIFMCTLMAFSIWLAFGFLMPTLATFGWLDRLLAIYTHDNILTPLRNFVGWSGETEKKDSL